MAELIIVGLIVVAAGGFAGLRIYRSLRRKAKGCGGNCSCGN